MSNRNQSKQRCALLRRKGFVIVSSFVMVSACGGSSPSAPTPPPSPLPALTLQVSPNPLQATMKNATATAGTFEIVASVNFHETAGMGGRITQVTGSVVRLPSNQMTSANLDVSLPFASFGSTTGTYTQDFDVAAGIDSVVWRLTASGVDSQGRSFTASSGDIPVNPPVVAPPPIPVSSSRVELWGGPGSSVFLGCFNCNQFASDSVFNQFGTYGSPFSTTSVWNQFSPYGSPFSNDSACNPFASNPPQLVNRANNTYTELTLNQFRPFADKTPAVVNVLTNAICRH